MEDIHFLILGIIKQYNVIAEWMELQINGIDPIAQR
jgi:hypothetical protein